MGRFLFLFSLLQFDTDLGKYNLYIKHTTKSRDAIKKGRNKRSWYVGFTTVDIRKLATDFPEDGYDSFIILVLSSTDLDETKVAAIPYKDAMKHLSSVYKNGDGRINIIRYGGDHEFICYGVDEKESSGTKVYVNHMRYFDPIESCKGDADIVE